MLVYVASPYLARGVDDPATAQRLTEWRARAVLRATAKLQHSARYLNEPILFYSPIAYEHTVCRALPNPADGEAMRADGEYWLSVDRLVLERMQHCVIIGLPGWTASAGVYEEALFFSNMIGARLAVYPMRYASSDQAIQEVNKALADQDYQSDKYRTILNARNIHTTPFNVIQFLKGRLH